MYLLIVFFSWCCLGNNAITQIENKYVDDKTKAQAISPGLKLVQKHHNIEQRIAFGSCHTPKRGGDIWHLINMHRPDRLLLLGDNMYADGKKGFYNFERATMDDLAAQYRLLKENKHFQNLVRSVGGWEKINAIFDDHDFGLNNADKTFYLRNDSQQLFWDFSQVPADSLIRKQSGVYNADTIVLPSGFVLKIVALDTRSNKDPAGTVDGDFLGAEQWNWTENELTDLSISTPDLIILASSIQVLPMFERLCGCVIVCFLFFYVYLT